MALIIMLTGNNQDNGEEPPPYLKFKHYGTIKLS
jgi:hypothetical protein